MLKRAKGRCGVYRGRWGGNEGVYNKRRCGLCGISRPADQTTVGRLRNDLGMSNFKTANSRLHFGRGNMVQLLRGFETAAQGPTPPPRPHP